MRNQSLHGLKANLHIPVRPRACMQIRFSDLHTFTGIDETNGIPYVRAARVRILVFGFESGEVDFFFLFFFLCETRFWSSNSGEVNFFPLHPFFSSY